MNIEIVPINKLKPYDKNARKHTDADINTIVNSIKQFGFNDPVGIWGEDNTIVEGHGRVLAAKKLQMTKVPCIRLDHLSDEQRRAYALAHNKTAEMSSWLDDILAEEIADIADIDMEDFGFLDDKDQDEKKAKKEDGEVPFSEELLLTHNYIVLYFDNDFDWEVAQDKFGIRKVKDLIPRKGQPVGVGRVINGKEVLEWLN